MLGILCSRSKLFISNPLFLTHHHHHHHHSLTTRLVGNPASFAGGIPFPSDGRPPRHHHSSSCLVSSAGNGNGGGGIIAASVWHGLTPSSGGISVRRNILSGGRNMRVVVREEGSWNVAWDARPARWLHGSDSAWLLFGVCACFQPLAIEIGGRDFPIEIGDSGETAEDCESPPDANRERSEYRVTGVSGDGRCLFRAVAYGDCLKNGKAAPDESLQRELADGLRAKVADELTKRRDETECFIEGDFESYVKNIQQPHTWGGEPELLMASHVLQRAISVFSIDQTSRELVRIASYGQEYNKGENPITVLFHGYGHYDALEVF